MMKGEKEFLQAAAAVITESSSSITQHVYWHNWTSAMGERRERERAEDAITELHFNSTTHHSAEP